MAKADKRKAPARKTASAKASDAGKAAPVRGTGFFRSMADALMILLTVAEILVLLAAAKGPALSPAKLPFSPYANYLMLPMAVVNLLFAVYWLRRLKGWILLPVLALVFTFQETKAWFPVNFSKEAPSLGQELKVLTCNTMQFSSYQPHTQAAPNPVVRYVRNSDADIVCLQEAGVLSDPQFLTEQALTVALNKTYPYRYSQPTAEGADSRNMLRILSRFPIQSSGRISMASEANGACYADVVVGKERIRVICCHLESNKLTAADKAVYREIIDNRNRESVSNVAHQLGGKLVPAAVIRARQADKLAHFIEDSPCPVIVCGDFNDIPNSYTVRTVGRRLTDSWTECATGPGISFHEKFYRFRIDYIMHSPQLGARDIRVDRKADFSDHYPVTAFIQLP